MKPRSLILPGISPSCRRFGVATLLLMLLTGAGHLPGQVSSSTNERRLEALFAGMHPSQNVQLITPEILVEDAEFVSVTPMTVELRQVGTGVPITVDLSAIQGVSIQKRHWLQGTLWGMGGGVLAGSVFGLMIGSFKCRTVDGCGVAERRGARVWGATLGAVGGSIGFVLGRRDVYWHPVFP